MNFRWMATPLAAAMVLAPAGAAFAQEPVEGDAPTEETVGEASALELFEQLIAELAAELSGLDEDDEARQGVADAITLLADEVAISVVVMTATAEVGALEDDETADDETDGDETEKGENHGAIVSTVARCAPRGQGVTGVFSGLKNHGKYVSAAAHGDSISISLPFLNEDRTAVESTEDVTFDLSTLEGAEQLCTALAFLATVNDLAAEAAGDDAVDEKDAAKDERDAAKDERKADRDAAKADRDEARETAKADRDTAKDERKAGEPADDDTEDGDDD